MIERKFAWLPIDAFEPEGGTMWRVLVWFSWYYETPRGLRFTDPALAESWAQLDEEEQRDHQAE